MTASRREHLSWENFKEFYLDPGVPATHPIPGTPAVEVFVTARTTRLGMRVYQSAKPSLVDLPLKAVDLVVHADGRSYVVEVSTTHEELFRTFFGVISELADSVQLDGTDASTAVLAAASRLAALAAQKTRLSEEAVCGLIGELWVLNELLAVAGPSVLTAWLGQEGEHHDFRIGELDIEVKTTAEPVRRHLIHGAEQLVPSGARALFLLSVQLARTGAGHGMTLPTLVDEALGQLGVGTLERDKFTAAMVHMGYREQDRHLYDAVYHLRSEPLAFSVEGEFPRLTRERIEHMVGVGPAVRIDKLSYRILIEGLPHACTARSLIRGAIKGDQARAGSGGEPS